MPDSCQNQKRRAGASRSDIRLCAKDLENMALFEAMVDSVITAGLIFVQVLD